MAQSASSYSFTATTGTYTEIPAGAPAVDLPGTQADTQLSLAQPIGFTFVYEGVGYTQFRMGSNGFISLNATATAALSANDFATANTTSRPIIAPLWDDLDGAVTTPAVGVARYRTTGTAPNRVLTVEWRNWQWNWSATGNTISFQAILYETTNVIEFIYRQESGAVNAGSASIGIGSATGSGAGSYLNLTSIASPATSSTSSVTNLSTKPATGTIYRFTPPVPCTGTPTAGTIPSTGGFCAPSGTVSLTASGFTTGVTGITFQWEESNDNGVGDAWANAVGGTGATTSSYTSPTLSTNIFYRLRVTCTASGLSATTNSAAISVVNCSYDISGPSPASYTSIMPANGGTGTAYAGWVSAIEGDDNTSTVVSLAGTTFKYRGNAVTGFRACTNGWMTFNTALTATSFGNDITSTTQNQVLAPFWDDLVVTGQAFANLNGSMRYQISGTLGSGSAVITIEWAGMERFNIAGPNLNFQVKLYEAGDIVEFIYGNFEGFDGTVTSAYTYSIGYNGTSPATVSANERFNMTTAVTNHWTTTASNSNVVMPSCFTKFVLTPGTYTGPVSAPTIPAPGNDNSASALALTVNAVPCTSYCPIYYTSRSATNSGLGQAGCTTTAGNEDDDVWFSFTADGTNNYILTLRSSPGYDGVLQLFQGDATTNIACVNATLGGLIETYTTSGLAAGTYFVRVFHNGTGIGTSSGQFALCVSEVVPPPANDNICGSISLATGLTCTTTAGNTLNATASPQTACGGTPDDDLWYAWTANVPNATITVQSGTGFNAHVQAYTSSDNTCTGTLTSLGCFNATTTAGAEVISATNLTPGTTLFIRVYHTAAGAATGAFTICVTSTQPTCSALSAPADLASVVGSPVALSWAAATNATGYDVYADQTNPPTTLVSSNQAGLTFNYTPSTPTAGQTYFWMVVPRNALGTASDAPCAVRSFTLAAPACPVLTAPANGFSSTSGAVTLTWSASTGATGYDVFLDNNPTPTTQVSTNQAGLSFGPNATSPGLTYYWTVNAVGAYGTSSGCTVFSYNTNPPACVAAPTAPANAGIFCANSGNVVLSWPASAGAAGYDVVLDGITVSTNQAGLTYNAGALPLGTYTWSVIPQNSNGPATGCATWSFSVVANPVVSIGSVTPASGANCSGAGVSMTASGATTYSWSPTSALAPNATSAAVTSTVTSTTTYTVTGTDGTTGCTGTATQLVSVGNNPTMGSTTATPAAVCNIGTSQLNTSATVLGSSVSTGGALTVPTTLGNANPYPSTINVSGLPTSVSTITVTVTNLSHTWPIDLDVVLFGPTGAHSILFTDAIGGSGGITNRTYTFQTGATALPTTGFPASGTYGVVNGGAYNGSGTPSPVSNANLAVFNNTNPNGAWTLYVYDDASGDGGSIGSWSIAFNTSEPVTNYSWSPATFLSATNIANPQAVNINATTAYTVTATSVIGCTNTGNVTVTRVAPPNAGTNGTLTICAGSTVTAGQLFAQLGGTPDAGGSWSPAPAGAGVYTYTVAGTAPCANATATVTVTAQPQPNAGSNGTLTICAGSTVTEGQLFAALGGTPDAGGAWTPVLAGAGVYTYTVDATAPCTLNATATVTVTEQAQPNAGSNGNLVICAGSTVTAGQLFAQLGGTPDAGGTWSPTLAGAGVYTYTVVAAPCTNATATVTVSEQAAPNAGTNGTLTICAGSTVTAGQLFAALGGTPDVGGNWSPALAGAGTYIYTVNATAPCTTPATAQVVVTQQTAPNAGSNGTLTICINAPATDLFAQLGGTPDATGSWSGPSTLTGGNLGTFTPGTSLAGVYTYTVAGTAPCANASATVTLTYDNTDTDGDNIIDCLDNCPNLFGQNGDACDAGPNFVLGQIVNCACVGQQCTTDLVLEFDTDANASDITWELRASGVGILVQSGSGLPGPVNSLTVNTCLPDGCYYLRVLDAGGDGIANGGYILRTLIGAQRIIDNRDNFSSGSVSAVIGNGGFCLPLGTDKLIYTSCDKLDWVNNQFIVASENPAVSAQFGVNNANSGYQFWWFDPNGSYGYSKFRSHATSDGFGTGATRACHARINNWSPNQIPANVLMNVKVRSRVNGVNSNWGPVCRFKIDPIQAACPLTKLMDIPGNVNFSCGVTRPWGSGAASKVVARPVEGATQYQFRFVNGEVPAGVVRTTTTTSLQLNWTPALPNGTYQVQVRAFKNGQWCVTSLPWGDVCNVTITGSPNAMVLGGGDTTADGTPVTASVAKLFPNPNNGEQLTVSLSAVEEGVETVSVDIFDLSGARVVAKVIPVNDGMIYQQMAVSELASGVYMVHITAGSQRYTERLVIAK